MSLSNTVRSWGKELGRIQHEPTPTQRFEGRKNRPLRKKNEQIIKMAAKMKKEGYPSRFTSAHEEETS